MTQTHDLTRDLTPRLLVDVARLEANIARTATAIHGAGLRLRPHMKTSKCLEVTRRQRDKGVDGFTCATPAEVRLMGEAGYTGVLWAHQPVGAAKVAFAIEAAEAWGVTLTAESLEVARPLSDEAVRVGVTITMLMDVDAGHHRTGLPVDGDEVIEVARAIAALPNVRFGGIFTHEGHVGLVGTGRVDLEAVGRRTGEDMAALGARLREAGVPCEIVSVGSTPSMSSAPFASGVTEARPGTYVYFDAGQVRNGSCTVDDCALTVLTTVLAVHDGWAICDSGIKALSSDSITPQVGAGIVCDLDCRPIEGLLITHGNEEHGFMSGAVDQLHVGQRLRIIPNHACGTANMWSKLTALHPSGTYEEWQVQARY